MNPICEACKAACCYFGSPPLEDPDNPPKNPSGACAWLDQETGLCIHYDERPQVCKDLPPGHRICKSYQKRRDKWLQ